MKKFLLMLLLVIGTASVQATDVDPFTMVKNLERVINTSTNTYEIVEAERLINEVYAPLCREWYWRRVKYVAVGAVSAAALIKLTGNWQITTGGTAAIWGIMAYRGH